MYASMRRYRVPEEQMADVLHLVDVDFAESMQEMEGFVAYEVIVTGEGELLSMSIFRDREAAEASNDAAAMWVSDRLAREFDITRLDTMVGEVAVSRAMADLLEPAHS